MIRAALFVLSLLLCGSAAAQELTLRHALDGRALDALATLVVRFNDEQKGKVKPKVVLEDLRGVQDKQRLPDMAFLDADDGMAFFGTRPHFKPLAAVMKEGGQKFDAGHFYPQVADAVDDLSGKVQALPMGLSVPVLFYNRDAFRKAGLDADKPPPTWWEVQKAAGLLFDKGSECPLTSSYFSWVHVENVSTQHGEPIVAKSGKAERLTVNAMVNVKHLALLSSWYKSFYFRYFGPGNEGDAKFASGECAMLTGESAAYRQLADTAKFDVGVAPLPYYDDVYGVQPADVLPDGAALWVLPGKKKEEYKAIARFVVFLMRPEVQQEWVKATAFLPMTPAAMAALQASGTAPAVLAEAEKRLSAKKREARAPVGAGRSRIREILNEEVAFVWRNVKPAKEALDNAVARANGFLLSPAVAAPLAKK